MLDGTSDDGQAPGRGENAVGEAGDTPTQASAGSNARALSGPAKKAAT